MASTMTPAHSPAVNHPTQSLGGFSATHEPAAAHFRTDGIAHGTETVSSSVRKALEAPLSGWIHQGNGFVPAPGTTGVPGTNPSYVHNKDGSYTFSGNSGTGTAVTASTLAGAMAQWLGLNSGSGGTGGTTGGGGTNSPFNQLATLLSSLAAQTPQTTTPTADSPGTSIPTESGPSLVLPIMLLLLAAGAGYWWWSTHHKKAAAK